MPGVDELYVLARRVLLDALEALGAQREAAVLVGAQAVYLRVGEAGFAVAPFTTDGDLVIEPDVLSELPPLELILSQAGFRPQSDDSVGIWVTQRMTRGRVSVDVAVDLLVPASVSPGSGRRAARLAGHDARAARIVRGLEGALVDTDVMRLAAFEPDDGRTFEIRVAGPAGLLVSKIHKIAERQERPRQDDKDALDALRLLRGSTTEDLAARYARLLDDYRAREVASAALPLFRDQFAKRSGIGVQMVIRALGPLASADEIAGACELLAGDLLAALQR
jgi:hypothetical protein